MQTGRDTTTKYALSLQPTGRRVMVWLIAWRAAAEGIVEPPVKMYNACHENRVSVGQKGRTHTSAHLVQQFQFQAAGNIVA